MANHGWAETPLNLSKYVLCRPTKTAEAAFQSLLFVPKLLFTAVLLMQNCKRTEDLVMSVNPNFFCPPLPETHFLLPALLRATDLRTCMGFGVFDYLKPVDCSFAENVSCRLSAAPPDNLCKFSYKENLKRTVSRLNHSKPIHPVRPASPCQKSCALLQGGVIF